MILFEKFGDVVGGKYGMAPRAITRSWGILVGKPLIVKNFGTSCGDHE